MTAIAAPSRATSSVWGRSFGVQLTPGRHLARAALLVVLMASLSLLLELVVVSNLQQRSAQQRAFDTFRSDLALGTAPVGPTDREGRVLAPGTSVAFLEIPAIGLRQVVGEGSDPATLFDGPGHRRDTPLPGQVGTSMILGRRASFGGPFSEIGSLDQGDEIKITTGQGVYEYTVRGVRHEGDPAPPTVETGKGRLLLVTASGRPFMPTGVLRVDAELKGTGAATPRRLVSSANLPPAEQIMGADTSTLWALALWLQALVLVTLLAVYAWHRWGRAKAWVIFLPPLLLIGMSVASEAARIMPNLL